MHRLSSLFLLLMLVTIVGCSTGNNYPPTKMVPVTNDYHGTSITDNYRWLEDSGDPEVQAWVDAQNEYTTSIIANYPEKTWLEGRFNELWRYDDETVPRRSSIGERLHYSMKLKEDDKWRVMTKADENAEAVEVLNPNEWDENEALNGKVWSRDGKYLAYGVANGGDENPRVRIMEVSSDKLLPDTLRGTKQYVTSWMPDNSGFYYSAKPYMGEVPEGEEEYYHSAWYHKLGTPGAQDVKVFWNDEVKEYWHSVYISEDGEWIFYERSLFNSNDVYYRSITSREGSQQPLVTGQSAQYSVDAIDGRLYVTTDKDAPMWTVYTASMRNPVESEWTTFIPEREDAKLESLGMIDGRFYATYLQNAHTVIQIFNTDGELLRDLALPTMGTASVSGNYNQPNVWVRFSSYAYPSTTFKYDFTGDKLTVYREFPLEVDTDNMMVEQVWYPSRDGTRVSMFIVRTKDMKMNGSTPAFLTGYGGFNISMEPYFSTTYLTFLEAGGMVAIPNLRGGGEYGREWHEAGMLENKQNVFDDFIAAAEYLIDNKYTSSDRLGIMGGSNGGLLVGAVAVQRPELFKAVYCAVPLLDMVNYHTFGLANIWAEEYGSSDDPEQFEYLYAYSPYHNVIDETSYPAMIVTGSANDARVDPLHARKFVARLRQADPDGAPILLLEHKDSGHGGGVGISKQIEQRAMLYGFVMHEIGLKVPRG
ncbi:prolyl endopeptidase [bacterium BMS3Bbin04]|nr:prolyl endopeptidase [bacterium BMS3Bbin04]